MLTVGHHTIQDIAFEVPIRNKHSVETYGLKFLVDNQIISIVSDTKYAQEIVDVYRGSTVLILNVVFYQHRPDYDHLSLEEAIDFTKKIKPRKTIFTHFGMSMLKAKPHLLEKKIRKELNLDITFSYDGLNLEIPVSER